MDKLKESLSSLIDNELEHAEIMNTLEALTHHPELLKLFFQYQIIGDTLRTEIPEFVFHNVANIVWESAE